MAAPLVVPDLDDFTKGYIEAMLWASMDESNEQGGEPLDQNYTLNDLSQEALDQIIADCKTFQVENTEALGEYGRKLVRHTCEPATCYAGHDFFLSRNGHGAGYFDRGLNDLGDKLQDAARKWSESNPYVGDDGRIYLGG